MAEGPEQQLQASARGGALILGSPLFCIFARFCFWYQPFFPESPDMSWIQSSTMWMPLSIEEFLNNAQFLNFW